MKHSPLRALAVIGAALVLMIGGAVAHATTTTPSTITACMIKASGTIRIVDASTTCRVGEEKMTWNQQGVPGTNGTPGTNGAAGTNGVSGYEIVPTQGTFNPSFVDTFAFSATSTCPSGKKAISFFATATLHPLVGTARPGAVSGSFISPSTGQVFVTFAKADGLPFVLGESMTWTLQLICAAAL